jgi:DNA-binding CsgD family transcriptional regulator
LHRLGVVLDQIGAGRGRVAVVEGPAGIGKSRMLEAVLESAAERGLLVLSARGSDLERQFPYGVVRQLYAPTVAMDGAGAVALEGPAAYAGPVFDPGASVTDDGGVPADRAQAVVHGLHWLTCDLAERGPLVVAVDDAHWADAPSLLFLHYLARRLGSVPVALVLGSRQGEPGPEAELVRRIAATAPESVLALRPLSARATAELVRSLLGSGTPDELCGACHVASGGNPLLLRELASALLADGVAPDARAVERVARLVPDSVARHVLVRLSRLPEAAVRVARAVAVLGPGAELRHAAALAGVTERETADAVDRLVAADILAARRPLEFAHPLLGQAVYADTRPGERALAHAKAARLLSDAGSAAERVALQLLACEPAGCGWAVEALRGAARDSAARGAPQTAARYLGRALAEPPGQEQRGELLLELGIAESRAAEAPAAEHLAEALALTREPVARARVAQELAGLYNHIGRFVDSADVLEEAIDVLGEADRELRFSLEAEAGVLALTVLSARRRLAPRMAALLAKAPLLAAAPAAAPLLAVVADELASTDGTAQQAAAYAERAFADGRLLTRDGAVAAVGTSALVSADRPARAEALLDAVISAARLRGSVRLLGGTLACRASARNRRGRVAAAAADARLALELSPDEPADPVRPLKLAWLAEPLIELGEWDEAEALVSATELGRCDPDSMLVQPLLDSHARLLLHTGRPREACEQLDAQLAWQQEWGCRNPGWTSTRSLAALAHRALGESDAAAALAGEDLDAARAFGAPRSVGVALRTVALVKPSVGIEPLGEAVAVLEGSEARLELARTLLELGAALRRAGRRRDARAPLQRGLELSDDCGGAVVAEQARTELLASGARPRHHPTNGPDALTPSERRVAAKAAQGHTNREIAQGLFLSKKTVEMHLSHVYRKLGIHSRAQLAATLDQDENTKA